MRCAWKELLSILPPWMRSDVDKFGRLELQELRLRVGWKPELVLAGGRHFLSRPTAAEDLSFCINAASHYSPWTAETSAQGYITCPGGHRIGLCGDVVMQQGAIRSIKNIRSACIRVARDFPGISDKITDISGSVLIIGPPGSGKTTLLRDLIRRISKKGPGSIAVVDERCELFPDGVFDPGPGTDILSGCPKPSGLDMLVRTMGPEYIALDEITAEEDCEALIRAGNCGVRLAATCHGWGRADLDRRPIYRMLVSSGIFETLVVLHADKSLGTERMMQS